MNSNQRGRLKTLLIRQFRNGNTSCAWHGGYPQTTALELRQQLDYLADRKMVDLNKAPHGLWFADLTSLGVDIAEYTVECRAGIARPEKVWS